MYSKRLRIELLYNHYTPTSLTQQSSFSTGGGTECHNQSLGNPNFVWHRLPWASWFPYEFKHIVYVSVGWRREFRNINKLNLFVSIKQGGEPTFLYEEKRLYSAPNLIFTKTRGSNFFVATETESNHLLLYCLVWQNSLTSAILSVD